jgi:hypothetical protein
MGIGGKVHGRIVKCGFDTDAIVETLLVRMYGEIRCLYIARKVLDGMLMKDVVCGIRL